MQKETFTCTPLEIKKLRISCELSQEAFGKHLGVAEKTVSCWECGTRKPNPTALFLLKQINEEINKNTK